MPTPLGWQGAGPRCPATRATRVRPSCFFGCRLGRRRNSKARRSGIYRYIAYFGSATSAPPRAVLKRVSTRVAPASSRQVGCKLLAVLMIAYTIRSPCSVRRAARGEITMDAHDDLRLTTRGPRARQSVRASVAATSRPCRVWLNRHGRWEAVAGSLDGSARPMG